MIKRNIRHVKGDTLSFDVKVSDLDAASVSSIYFSAKVNPTDSTYAFQKSLSNGITLVDTNMYKVRVAPADTASLPVGKYYFDLQIGLGDDIYTVLMGIMDLVQDVTVP